MKKMLEMPDDARIWIYQADRFLTEVEIVRIKTEITSFLATWSSHGAQMDSSFEVLHHRVLIIAVNESQALASGCGIDKSVNFVKQLGSEMGLDFFNRTLVLYDNQGVIAEAPLHQFWAMRKALIIQDETLVLDTTLQALGQLRAGFLRKFQDSWHAEMWGR
jgi:hypothetical protein